MIFGEESSSSSSEDETLNDPDLVNVTGAQGNMGNSQMAFDLLPISKSQSSLTY